MQMRHTRSSGPQKVAKALATVVACAFVFGPAAAAALGQRATPMENRPLAARPAVSEGWDALDMLTAWASDHLPVRNHAVRTNAWIDYHVLGGLPAAASTNPKGPDPLVVRGRDEYLFVGEDFTFSCVRGKEFDRSLRSMLELAAVIEASGRRAVVVIGPNKSSVAPDKLPRVVPRGDCATDTMAAQERTMGRTTDPRFVNLLPGLREAESKGLRPYWKTDSHWSPNGAAVYARTLADRLRPGTGALATTSTGTQVFSGDLAKLVGLPIRESADITTLRTGTVQLQPYAKKFVRQGVYYGPQRWTVEPSTGLVPGRTLFLGDSFGYYASDQLRPFFAQGTLLWMRTTPARTVAAEIAKADTVVLESVQRATNMDNTYTKPAFRAQVAAALAGR
jgi:alginate O-acetyltransferase complex protein AlgJ